MDGKLYIVATPIGNLGDITLRALEVLKTVDYIACEDTRHTRKLASRYNIKSLLISYHQHNKIQRTDYLVKKLKESKHIALVTDAGTPGISDPGYFIIKKCIEEHIDVEPIPGPCALATALSVSGFPTKEVLFVGFLPTRKGKRRKYLEKLSKREETIVIYVSPHKIEKLLNELNEIFPNRKVILARELTKKFEEKIRTDIENLPEIYQKTKPRGEFTLIIAPPDF